MLRISLILVIVAALGALGLSQMTATRLKDTQDKLTATENDLTATQGRELAARTAEREAKRQAEDLRNQLETTQLNLGEVQAKLTQQENRANELESNLNDALRTKNGALTRLAEWNALERTPQQMREVLAENQRMTVDMQGLSEENLVLDREVRRLRNRLSQYEGEEVKVELPSGLRGKVLAVDPKFDFVVLNVGEQDGVLERGEMLVNRGGKLVARVRIVSVEDMTSVANVMEDWKQADVMEGDVVTVGL